MISIICHRHRDEAPRDVWNKYFASIDSITEYYQCSNCNISSFSTNIYIFECSFTALINRAIYIKNNSSSLLHSLCFFDRCSTDSLYAGVIYIKCNSVIQDRFCSYNSTASKGHGSHSLTTLINSGKNLNIVTESCLTHCQGKSETISMIIGLCGIFSTNFSENTAFENSGFAISGIIECSIIKFSTFERNNASGHVCLMHQASSAGKFHDFFCNIINNTQKDSRFGTLRIEGTELIVENCSVHLWNSNGNNFAKSADDSKLIIINCNVTGSLIHKEKGSYTAINVRPEFNLNLLPHISLQKCYAMHSNISNEMNHETNQKFCQFRIHKTQTNLIPYFRNFKVKKIRHKRR